MYTLFLFPLVTSRDWILSSSTWRSSFEIPSMGMRWIGDMHSQFYFWNLFMVRSLGLNLYQLRLNRSLEKNWLSDMVQANKGLVCWLTISKIEVAVMKNLSNSLSIGLKPNLKQILTFWIVLILVFFINLDKKKVEGWNKISNKNVTIEWIVSTKITQ